MEHTGLLLVYSCGCFLVMTLTTNYCIDLLHLRHLRTPKQVHPHTQQKPPPMQYCSWFFPGLFIPLLKATLSLATRTCFSCFAVPSFVERELTCRHLTAWKWEVKRAVYSRTWGDVSSMTTSKTSPIQDHVGPGFDIFKSLDESCNWVFQARIGKEKAHEWLPCWIVTNGLGMVLGYVIDTQYRHAVTTCHGHHQSLCETHPCGSYKRPRGATEDFQAARNSCGVARSLTTLGPRTWLKVPKMIWGDGVSL